MVNYGYWIFGKDMDKVNLETLKNNGITDIFLNYYAFTAHSESKVLEWIKKAQNNNISVHIWVQCFYDGEWHNPATTDLSTKKAEIKKYANLTGIKGVHLDYLRYPGDAYKTEWGANSITCFVREVRNENPKTFLSCAIMPENENKKYYGQDIDELGKIVDAVIPMQYKGNYKSGTEWLASTTKNFSSKGTIWSGLQTYKSDNDTTLLSSDEVKNDAKTCLDNGAKGIVLFRYGMCPEVNFNGDKKMTKYISNANIYKMAQDVKSYVEKNKKYLPKATYDGVEFTWNEIQDILTYCLLNLNSNCNANTYKWCANATGDSINENVLKDDYMDQAKRVHNYIIKNGQIPNFVTSVKSKKKVDIDLFTYCVAKILVFYKNNKQLPNYCLYDSNAFKAGTSSASTSTTTTTSSTLKPYLTSQGCSGMGQCTGYYCACNSLQQCFYRLTGIQVAESTIASVAGTTSAGTGHAGIETAVAWFNKKYKTNIKITWKNFSDVGWTKLQEYMNKGAVFCHLLYRDQYGHYEVPKQISGDNIIVLNSLGNSCGGAAYCGYIETRSKSTQQRYINGISQKSIAILTKG